MLCDCYSIISENFLSIENSLRESIKLWKEEVAGNRMTLAPIHQVDTYLIGHIREDNFDILVIFDSAALDNAIISGFVLGTKNLDRWELKNGELGCNTYDTYNILHTYNFDDFI